MKIEPHEEFLIWRKREELTQEQAAVKFGVSQGYISHMEQGVRPVLKRVMAEVPKVMKLTDGERLMVMMRRRGFDMNLGVAKFGFGHAKLLAMLRDEEKVPKEVWEVLREDQNRFLRS